MSPNKYKHVQNHQASGELKSIDRAVARISAIVDGLDEKIDKLSAAPQQTPVANRNQPEPQSVTTIAPILPPLFAEYCPVFLSCPSQPWQRTQLLLPPSQQPRPGRRLRPHAFAEPVQPACVQLPTHARPSGIHLRSLPCPPATAAALTPCRRRRAVGNAEILCHPPNEPPRAPRVLRIRRRQLRPDATRPRHIHAPADP